MPQFSRNARPQLSSPEEKPRPRPDYGALTCILPQNSTFFLGHRSGDRLERHFMGQPGNAKCRHTLARRDDGPENRGSLRSHALRLHSSRPVVAPSINGIGSLRPRGFVTLDGLAGLRHGDLGSRVVDDNKTRS